MRLSSTVIYDNVATVCSNIEPSTWKCLPSPNSHCAWQIDTAAALYVEGGRLRLENGTRFANNSFLVELAEVIYVRLAEVLLVPRHESCCLQSDTISSMCAGFACAAWALYQRAQVRSGVCSVSRLLLLWLHPGQVTKTGRN